MLCGRAGGLFGWVETGVDTDALCMLDEGYCWRPGVVPMQSRKTSTLDAHQQFCDDAGVQRVWS